MNKLTICKGDEKYNIYIDDYKVFIGNNYNLKFDIVRSLNKFYKNDKPSEYAEEYNNIPNIFLNDKQIKNKELIFINVNKYYSITEDCKLTSQSLITKYFETLLDNQELSETINTINILFESLTNEISLLSPLTGNFNFMHIKQLLKLLNPFYLFNEEKVDEYDLSLEELILFQLRLIETISSKNINKTIIVCVEIPELTNEIYKQIVKMKDCNILIFVNKIEANIDISKYIFCERKYLDCANEDEFFNIICDNNYKFMDLQEGKKMMDEYINKGTHIDFVNKILK